VAACGWLRAALPVLLMSVLLLMACVRGSAQEKPQPLDSVIAVANNQVILASDLDLEMRIASLLPGDRGASVTPLEALDRLTTRALIEQQIVQEDPHGLDVDLIGVSANLTDLRQNLPACKRHGCGTDAEWSAYLKTLGLTPERVNIYWGHRMAVLAFIERRFRSGIRVTPEEIETYYRRTLTPQYPKPADVPPLAKVSERIQEVLLQQRVNALLNDWLKSLQAQGEVEVLDPALAAASAAAQRDADSSSDGNGPAGKGGAQ
jgi:hypothetical protein